MIVRGLLVQPAREIEIDSRRQQRRLTERMTMQYPSFDLNQLLFDSFSLLFIVAVGAQQSRQTAIESNLLPAGWRHLHTRSAHDHFPHTTHRQLASGVTRVRFRPSREILFPLSMQFQPEVDQDKSDLSPVSFPISYQPSTSSRASETAT